MELEKVTCFDDILNDCWSRLSEGAKSNENEFHFPVLATSHNQQAEARTIVLREFIEENLIFFTDYRSPKINQIKGNDLVSFLFYDKKDKIQLSIKAKAIIHHENEISNSFWENLKPKSKNDYNTSLAPSTIIEKNYNHNNSHLGDENFAVVYCKILEIDWLKLEDEENKRARFRRTESGFMAEWLVP